MSGGAGLAGAGSGNELELPRGRAGGARVGGALPRAGRRLPGAGASRAGRVAGEAAAVAAGGGRAVRRRAPRSRRASAPGDDALAVTAVLRVLRQHGLGAGDPGRAADRGAEPERDPLADLAGADGARAARRRLGVAAPRPAGGLARPHRGHRLHLDVRRDRRGAARDRGPRRRLLGAGALVGREGGADARARMSNRPGRRGVPPARGRARPRRCVLRRRDRRDDVDDLGRPGARDRGRLPRSGRLAARRRGLRRLGHGLPGVSLGVRRRRARRLARRQPAQVAADADGLLAAVDEPAGRLPRRVLARPRIPAGGRRGRQPRRLTGPRSGGASVR